jgi:hypothetical protein
MGGHSTRRPGEAAWARSLATIYLYRPVGGFFIWFERTLSGQKNIRPHRRAWPSSPDTKLVHQTSLAIVNSWTAISCPRTAITKSLNTRLTCDRSAAPPPRRFQTSSADSSASSAIAVQSGSGRSGSSAGTNVAPSDG